MQSTILKPWLWSAIILSGVGFLDSTYLSINHYFDALPPCFVITGCDTVLTSSYAVVGGLPVADWGIIYYLFLLLFFMIYLDLHKKGILVFASWATIVGFLATTYFLYLQIFVIQSLCIYCLVSAFSSIGLFLAGQKMLRLLR